jgi:branched-chain amino acid transport system ATP-binding protein
VFSLKVDGLTVRYGRLTAVNAVSMEVAAGDVVAVVGANGAGKTSLLSGISGAVPSAGGRVLLDEVDLTRRSIHRRVRFGLMQVPEGRRIIAPLTVEENLLLGAYAVRGRAAQREPIEDVFELFPALQQRRALAGGLLSGGEQQMLAIGRALMSRPKVLLLDEPSMGLAPNVFDRVLEVIKEIAARGVAIVMVEQNLAAALEVARYVYMLDHGEAVRHGKPDVMARDPLVVDALLGGGAVSAETVEGRRETAQRYA